MEIHTVDLVIDLGGSKVKEVWGGAEVIVEGAFQSALSWCCYFERGDDVWYLLNDLDNVERQVPSEELVLEWTNLQLTRQQLGSHDLLADRDVELFQWQGQRPDMIQQLQRETLSSAIGPREVTHCNIK